jgi:large subunit ribosomal protein L7/L12
MSTKLDTIVETLSSLTVLEASELSKMLEEKWGVSAAAPVAAAAAPTAAVEEKTEFDVVLKAAGDKKLEVIKVIREITGLGLKEAKDMSEASNQVIKSGVSKNEAEEIQKKFIAAGATIALA